MIDDSLDGSRSLRFFLNTNDLIQHRFSPALSYLSVPGMRQLYWTKSGDLIISEVSEFAHVTFSGAGVRRVRRIATQPYWPAVTRDADLAPAFVEDGSAFAAGFGASENVLEFKSTIDRIRITGMKLDGADSFLWDGGKGFFRTKNSNIDRYSISKRMWLKSDLPALAAGSDPILLRNKPSGGVEVATLTSGSEDGMKSIAILRSGDRVAHRLVSGQIFQPLMSPSGKDIYGYLEPSGKFVHIADSERPRNEERWLKSFAGRDELRDIGFLDRGRLAIVKLMSPLSAPHFEVLGRDRRDKVQRWPVTCANVDRGVRNVFHDEHNVFFSSSRTDALIIYVHGGPENYVDRGGNWMTDAFTAAGYPVVAVNYAGSSGRSPSGRELNDLAKTFSADISDGVALAKSKMNMLPKKLIVVTDSFGSLVVLAAIATGKLHPTTVIVIDGLVSASSLLLDGLPPDKQLGRFLQQTKIELKNLITPARLAAESPSTYYDFIHGENDATAPLSDVEKFVAMLGSSRLQRHPNLVIVPQMYHEPTTKSNFQFILREIYTALYSKR